MVLADKGDGSNVVKFDGRNLFVKKDEAILLALTYINDNLNNVDKALAREMMTMATSSLENNGEFRCPGFRVSVVRVTSKGEIIGADFNE